MPIEQIFTDREEEAIYEYSDKGPINLAKIGAGSAVIELFFNEGSRILKITDEEGEKSYELAPPKKPDNTGGIHLIFQSKEFFVPETVASALETMFPDSIQKAPVANRHKESVG